MDDFQIWLYIIFGIIYFIAKGLRKKQPEDAPGTAPDGPGRGVSSAGGAGHKRPMSFEELLREFTEGRQAEQEEEERQAKEPEAVPSEPEKRFSDDETRRVYEESVKRAGEETRFLSNESHVSLLKEETAQEEEEEDLAASLKEMLNDPDGSRKAIVLSEILHRKY